ncbi:WXG100-like domain-containing protein [Actinopolymorpha pittospori]
MELPSWLTEPLSWIGLEWPQADEVKLFEAGQAWIAFGMRLQPVSADASAAAARVVAMNEGRPAEAFYEWWQSEDGPARRLDEDVAAVLIIGAALILFAALTVAMKLLFAVQLAVLAMQVAAAVAAAFATFGASSATIPGFVAATRAACTRLVRRFVDDVLKKNIAKLLEKAKALLKKIRQRGLLGGRGPITAKKVAPNATVEDLLKYGLPDVNGSPLSIGKNGRLVKLTERDLLNAVLNPRRGDYIMVALRKDWADGGEGPIGWVRDGNHRALNLLRWARQNEKNPGTDPLITWETEIYVIYV